VSAAESAADDKEGRPNQALRDHVNTARLSIREDGFEDKIRDKFLKVW
jgi:hypothetical protein